MRDRVQNTAGKVTDKIQETTGRVTDVVSDAATTHGAPVMDQASEQISSRMDMGKNYATEAITGIALALRQTSQHLREEGAQPMLAQYAERGAEQIELVGGYLRHRESGQIVSDLESFARRQPLAFAGGAFALGLLATRFFRAGTPTQSNTPSTSPYSSPSYAGSPPSTPSAPPASTPSAPPASSIRTGTASGTPPTTGVGNRTTSPQSQPSPQPSRATTTGAAAPGNVSPSSGMSSSLSERAGTIEGSSNPARTFDGERYQP